MRKYKILMLVPLLFILFSLGVSHASANNKPVENLDLHVNTVSKHLVTGNTNKYTKVNALGKSVKSNSKGYFRIYVKNGVRYGKLTKFHLSKNKLTNNVYARLYNTAGVNINTVSKATKHASSIISGKSAHDYHWGGTYDKNSKSYLVRPVNEKLVAKGFTGTGNFYNVAQNGIIYNSAI